MSKNTTVNELVCTFKCNLGKITHTDISLEFYEFYSAEEMEMSKEILIDLAGK